MDHDRSDPSLYRDEKSLVDDAAFNPVTEPGPTSDSFSNADLAIKTHCQRQRLPHPSDRRWKACQEAAHPPSPPAGGKRVEVSTRVRAPGVHSLKNAFFQA
ncbi:unnamed protein product [Lasius platythorax]|uniref:Uncharacterized protein n=1 Tax=Lasius platythorax TaxID=488582 RepID=A0AAV2P1D5_9HYME